MIDAKLIQRLRTQTGGGIVDCKKALEESGNDYEKALELMRKQGQKSAAKRVERETHEGIVHSYIHANNKTGVLVEVLCETDFVARNEAFQAFVHDIALHIAAMSPLYISTTEVPEDMVAKEKEIYREQMVGEQKPAEILEKIIDGKLAKFYEDICLLNQKFIKDDTLTIGAVLTEQIAKTGENIQIKRFARFAL
ncbi:MAG: translation elongation factor Ts [bacterium]|nr:translation elongation factor Ts [bacterium]